MWRRWAIGDHRAWAHNGADLDISGEDLPIGGCSKISSDKKDIVSIVEIDEIRKAWSRMLLPAHGNVECGKAGTYTEAEVQTDVDASVRVVSDGKL